MNGLIYLGIFSLTIIIIILGLFKEMSWQTANNVL